ncbi:hypothetical protein JW933_06705 [candidate division FCPU426 bacterium]|nr:hypothetical protein [candidate division FCPU426 bacterium]
MRKAICLFSAVLFVFCLLLALEVKAQKDAAVLLSREMGPYETALRSFKSSATFSYDLFNMEGSQDQGKSVVQKIGQGEYSMVITLGTEAALVADKIPENIPVVYSMVLAPLQGNKPNASCVYIKVDVEAQINSLKKYFPAKNRIGVVYNLQTTSHEIAAARKACEAVGIKLSPIAVENRAEVPKALGKLQNNAVDIIWMVPDTTIGHPEAVKQFISHAQSQNLPLIGFSVFHVKAGALAAFSADYSDIGKQTARLAAKIKNKSVSRQVEGPQKIIFYVNPTVQKKLGLTALSAFSEVQFIE